MVDGRIPINLSKLSRSYQEIRFSRPCNRNKQESPMNAVYRLRLSSRSIATMGSLSQWFARVVLGIAVWAIVFTAVRADAGTLSSWRGTSSTSWGTTANWSTSVDTTGTFSLVFGGTTRTTTFNNLGVVNVDALSFTNTGTAGRNASFTIAGSGLRLVNATVTTTAVTTGTLSDTISAPLTIVGSSTFSLGGNHNLTLSGTVSGGSIYKTGTGRLLLTGSLASDLSIGQGILSVNLTASRGLNGRIVDIGTTTNFAGQLLFSAVSGVGFAQNNSVQFRLNDNAVLSTSGSSNVVFTNPTFNVATSSSNVTLILNGGGGGAPGTMTINGVIQDNTTGSVSVSIGEGNTWVLKGANTYTGTTGVASTAKLLMDGNVGSGAVAVAGYLGGSGTFGGAVSIIGSGTLSPGGSSTFGAAITETFGKLAVDSLSLGSGAKSLFTVGSTVDYDQVVGSSVSYGGTLGLTLTGTQAYAKDTVFNLFKDFATRTGGFSSITLAAAGTPYNGLVFQNLGGGIWETGSTGFPLGESLRFEETTGNLVVVPEPSTFILAGLGAVVIGARMLRRRQQTVA